MKRIVVLVFVSFFATLGTFAQNKEKSDPCKDIGHAVNAGYGAALGAAVGSTGGLAGAAAGAVAGAAAYSGTTDRSSNPAGLGGDVTKACKDGGWFDSSKNNAADKSKDKSTDKSKDTSGNSSGRGSSGSTQGGYRAGDR